MSGRCVVEHLAILEGVVVDEGAEAVALRDCVVAHLGGAGVRAAAPLALDQTLVEHCVDGVVSSADVSLTSSTVQDCSGGGILCDGTVTLEDAAVDAPLEAAAVVERGTNRVDASEDGARRTVSGPVQAKACSVSW